MVDRRAGLISFEAFGVTVAVASDRHEARARIPEALPPGWRPCAEAEAKYRLAILGDEGATYELKRGDATLMRGVSLDIALDSLASLLRMRVSQVAPDLVFIHAGVVGLAGGALLIPGDSFSGKTTLVAALVRAGAAYYSDEFAVLDNDGLVHPYPKPLQLRDGDRIQRNHHVESLGGIAGDRPVPIRAVVFTTYRQGSEWAPKSLKPSDASLALLTHAVRVKERPAEVLRATSLAVEHAIVLEGDRDEADTVAPLLLAELEARAA
jgi:hypothetical protein